MEKINIYCHKINNAKKINKYVNKLGYQIYEMTGGANFIKHTDLQKSKNINADELFKYIKTMVTETACAECVTKEKYLVILMGAPGSGKTLARKVAAKYIYTMEKSITDIDIPIIEGIHKSFIDISIDTFVYNGIVSNSEQTNALTGELLFKEIIASASTKEKSDKSLKLYNDLRPNFNPISEIILHLAAYLGLNVFFETLGSEEYILNLIQNFCKYYKYKLIIVYPQVTDEEAHIKRANDRAANDGRYIDPEYIKKTRIDTKNLFDKLKITIPKLLTEDFPSSDLITFMNDHPSYSSYNYLPLINTDIYSFRYSHVTKEL
jgi:predicted ABC-type ATPase